MSYLKDISLYLIISIIISSISHVLGSIVILDFLEKNIITIQLTLMAINTATSGLVVSKLQDIKEKHKEINIKPILKELKNSLKEQILLVVIAVVFILLLDSNVFDKSKYCDQLKFGFETLLIAVFVNSIQILWDTGKSIFVITDIVNEANENE